MNEDILRIEDVRSAINDIRKRYPPLVPFLTKMTVRGKDVWGGDISLDFDVEVYDLIPHFDSNSWMGMCASSWTVKYRELKTGAKFEEIVNLEDLKSEQKDDRGRI